MFPSDSSFQWYKAFGDIRRGSSWWRRQMTMGSSTTAIFGDLDCHVFRKVRDNAISILRRYATPCLLVTHYKNEWLTMTLSGHFISKCFFIQQGCRALTFALARHSSLITLQATWSFLSIMISSLCVSVILCIVVLTLKVYRCVLRIQR